MQGTTFCCHYYTWGHHNLYLGIDGEVKSKFIFHILNEYTASCTTKYTATYILRNSQINMRQKVYALNAHPITFILIYIKMKKKKCGKSFVLIWNKFTLHVIQKFYIVKETALFYFKMSLLKSTVKYNCDVWHLDNSTGTGQTFL